jgi:hypothetical protein
MDAPKRGIKRKRPADAEQLEVGFSVVQVPFASLIVRPTGRAGQPLRKTGMALSSFFFLNVLAFNKEKHHKLKQARKGAKKAKAFETQKLVKRLKELRRVGLRTFP